MEALTNKLTELTGAINALHDEIRRLESRFNVMEGQRVTLENDLRNEIRASIVGFSDQIGRIQQGNLVMPAEEPRTVPRGPMTEQELKDIGRLPDCVKELQIFEGNPSQYISWIHNVETILKDYELIREKPLYRSILQHIRQKIRGRADAALVSYNIFNDEWPEIKRVLSLHYADKRDIRTLEHQLNQLAQKGSRLDEFYATVNHQLSLIVNKIKSDDYSQETMSVLIETYRNRALDVFIRGLNAELSRMLIVQKPRTLPEAYSACLDMQNLTIRNNLIHVNSPNQIVVPVNNMASMGGQRPTLPPRLRSNNYWGNRPVNQTSYRPHFNNNRFSGNQGTSVPFSARTTPMRPEKMEIDGSTQTKQVNYMNRPQQGNSFKRSANSMGNVAKQQRVYHTELEQDEYDEVADDNVDSQQLNFMEDGLPAFLV